MIFSHLMEIYFSTGDEVYKLVANVSRKGDNPKISRTYMAWNLFLTFFKPLLERFFRFEVGDRFVPEQ